MAAVAPPPPLTDAEIAERGERVFEYVGKGENDPEGEDDPDGEDDTENLEIY